MHLDLEKIPELLATYHQEHLLQFWGTLRDEEKQHLLKQLKTIDFEHVQAMFKQTQEDTEATTKVIDQLMKPVPDNVYGGTNRSSPEDLDKFYKLGLTAISRGEVAVVLLAGGQGTRLGVDYPKGMYDVGLPSHKTLYQIQAERILRLVELSQQVCGQRGTIPWYIMTSEHTKHATADFFASHSYFGLQPISLTLFEQEMLPCFDFDGKIILENPHKVAAAPGGNGGLYRALVKEQILEDLKRRGIRYVHIFGVDNILVKVADPYFIGFCIAKDVECGNKVVEKTHPNEAVGVVCLVDGIWQVVEYSEISPETAQLKQANGSLMFNAGNIVNHFFTTGFLESVCREHEPMLKYHIAKKKIPHVDVSGNVIKPTKPNGIKMEKFVFDVFQFAKTFAVWEAVRKDEFSPLKNADGSADDTPTTARKSLYDLHRRYVEKAGGKFVDDKNRVLNGSQDVVCEISPLISYAGEGLQEVVGGKTFESPLELRAVAGFKYPE